MTEFRVVHGGTPADDELAAIVAVLVARSAVQQAHESRSLRTPLSPWVTSGLVKGTRTRV